MHQVEQNDFEVQAGIQHLEASHLLAGPKYLRRAFSPNVLTLETPILNDSRRCCRLAYALHYGGVMAAATGDSVLEEAAKVIFV